MTCTSRSPRTGPLVDAVCGYEQGNTRGFGDYDCGNLFQASLAGVERAVAPQRVTHVQPIHPSVASPRTSVARTSAERVDSYSNIAAQFLLTFGDFLPILVSMSDMAGHLLVTDVPAGVGVDQVSHALMRGRFHHVRDTIGPVARLWVYCPGDPRVTRSRVRHVIEAALAEQHIPMPVVFADEGWPAAPPATRPQSPVRLTSLRPHVANTTNAPVSVPL